MLRFARLILSVSLASIGVACSTAAGEKFSGPATPVNDQGDIYVYRASSVFALAQAFDVALDGKLVGSLSNASYLHLRLPAGKYLLNVSPGSSAKISVIEVKPELGKAIFFRYEFQYDLTLGPVGNSLFPNASIQPRGRETALLDLKELSAAK